ncbi:hypothetical protein [Saccharopolyspora sp. 7B]|uniref:hypothetical protein n=1 Tax=Saccharopolyspora sp. 7B TaxID=2877240 RepID=UPI001CD70D43|nr:hypothetical protein [Saccharopolyspora sp. 7B]MCA1281485.1 hypothetical protein [Saccharopolyspora sp. 7B]
MIGRALVSGGASLRRATRCTAAEPGEPLSVSPLEAVEPAPDDRSAAELVPPEVVPGEAALEDAVPDEFGVLDVAAVRCEPARPDGPLPDEPAAPAALDDPEELDVPEEPAVPEEPVAPDAPDTPPTRDDKPDGCAEPPEWLSAPADPPPDAAPRAAPRPRPRNRPADRCTARRPERGTGASESEVDSASGRTQVNSSPSDRCTGRPPARASPRITPLGAAPESRCPSPPLVTPWSRNDATDARKRSGRITSPESRCSTPRIGAVRRQPPSGSEAGAAGAGAVSGSGASRSKKRRSGFQRLIRLTCSRSPAC